jgi:hypothetical protein
MVGALFLDFKPPCVTVLVRFGSSISLVLEAVAEAVRCCSLAFQSQALTQRLARDFSGVNN